MIKPISYLYTFFIKTVFSTVLIFSLPLVSFSSHHGDIKALVLIGNLTDALVLTNNLLSSTPNNYELLFTKAMILQKSGLAQSAAEIYEQLVLLHPDMPEPFNNLAVYYANNGKLNLAIQTLEKALNTHASYWVSYKNLVSIYDQLASRAYKIALESKTPLPTLELSSIEDLTICTGIGSTTWSKQEESPNMPVAELAHEK